MNNEQLKQALMTECPVIYYELDQTPVRYAKIQRIIYQKQHSQKHSYSNCSRLHINISFLLYKLHNYYIIIFSTVKS